MTALRVLGLSGMALYEDRGRRHVASGVPGSGAFDRAAHAAATLLVGGRRDDAAVELVGWIELEVGARVTCAVTGPVQVWLDGIPAASWTALDVRAGSRLALRSPGRAYLAVAGGFVVDPVLGSRSTCVLGPVGPPPIAVGDLLPLSAEPCGGRVGDFCRPWREAGPLRAVTGPHLALMAVTARVVEASRIGVRLRLRGPQHRHRVARSLPSLGVLPGAIQVLPSGDWMALGPDSGTMGGYPVVGVVTTADVDRLAQVVAGQRVEIVPIEPDAAPPVREPAIVHVADLQR